jgi:hypothetical protein
MREIGMRNSRNRTVRAVKPFAARVCRSVNEEHMAEWALQHTMTPWSQAKMASSYKRVTRSQRAVMYPAKKMPKVRMDTGCI